MSLVTAFLNKKKELGLKDSIKLALIYLVRTAATKSILVPYYISGIIDYYLNPKALKQCNIERLNSPTRIRQEFIDRGIQVINYEIDRADFHRWIREAAFPEEYCKAYGTAFTEKALEHYLSTKLLGLNETDTYVDVAASGSNFYDQAEKIYGCKSFAVDLHLPTNIKDPRLIECDATDMPFEDKSISKMALHCAYEMFENDADINLIKEAGRVLSSGGKMVIVPLYMAHTYYILSGTKSNRRGIEYGKAKRVWWSNENHKTNRFTRFYSLDAFLERVVNNCQSLTVGIYYFTNILDMKQTAADQVYVNFAACFTKKE